MNRAVGVAACTFLLAACGPSDYEQAQRTQVLLKCRAAATFDQECAHAFDVLYGVGAGQKEKARLVAIAPTDPAEEQRREKAFHDRLFGTRPLKPVVLDGAPERKEVR